MFWRLSILFFVLAMATGGLKFAESVLVKPAQAACGSNGC